MSIKNKVTAAGIDIGSNSVRLLIAEVADNKIENIVYQEKATTRLASNISATGCLGEEQFNLTIDVLKNFKKAIDKYNVTKIMAVATSAVREAKNGIDFINEASKVGINISIISGIEEGILEYNGVCAGLDIKNNPVIVDVGGGSTEIIFKQDNGSISAESFKIGVVKMADMFDFAETTIENIEPCRNYVHDYFKKVTIPDNIEQFIATAGTATTIAAIDLGMKEYDWQKINGYVIKKDRIKEILYNTAKIPYKERINIVGMDKGREDLIIPGALIFLEILEKTNLQDITVSDFGLREGAVVRAANC